jgi:hypothetical protein
VPFVTPERVASHFRFGSKVDIEVLERDVRFTPKSGHQEDHRRLARKTAFPSKLCLYFLSQPVFGASEHFPVCSNRLVDSFF